MVALFLKTKITPEYFAEEIEGLLDRDELDRSFIFDLDTTDAEWHANRIPLFGDFRGY